LTIRAIIFDLDGTLSRFNLDYKAVRVEVRNLLMKNGVPATILSLNNSIFEMLERSELLMRNNGESDDALIEVKQKVLSIAEKSEFSAAKNTSLLPGVIETLKELKTMELKIGLFTINGSNSVNYILERFKIAGIFDAVIPRDEVKRVKPNTEHLETTLNVLKVTADEAVVVGDGITDMQSASGLDVIAVGLLTGIASRRALINSGANYIITAISDLPDLVLKINKMSI
jgi:phosphoglycolate phosphatase-like HAD superfamily hydrolase